jgi:hypothetical protein
MHLELTCMAPRLAGIMFAVRGFVQDNNTLTMYYWGTQSTHGNYPRIWGYPEAASGSECACCPSLCRYHCTAAMYQHCISTVVNSDSVVRANGIIS